MSYNTRTNTDKNKKNVHQNKKSVTFVWVVMIVSETAHHPEGSLIVGHRGRGLLQQLTNL